MAIQTAQPIEDDDAPARALSLRLAKQELHSTATSWVGFGLQAYVLRNDAHFWSLSLWLLTMTLMECTNALLAWRLKNRASSLADAADTRPLTFSLLITGIVWGFAALLPIDGSDSNIVFINLLVLAVVSIISILNLCSVRSALAGFSLGMAVPVVFASFTLPIAEMGLITIPALGLVLMVNLYGSALRKIIVNDIRSMAKAEFATETLRQKHLELSAALALIKHKASIDPLTECLNRRAFLEQFKAEVASKQRSDDRLGLLLLDIDHFKRVNDENGHAAGDIVLMATAKGLREELRHDDLLARWGGEEFLCLLKRIDPNDLRVIAEQLRSSLEQRIFQSSAGPIKISVSIGGAMHEHGQTIEETLEQADQALYRAKRAGRNRVELSVSGRAM